MAELTCVRLLSTVLIPSSLGIPKIFVKVRIAHIIAQQHGFSLLQSKSGSQIVRDEALPFSGYGQRLPEWSSALIHFEIPQVGNALFLKDSDMRELGSLRMISFLLISFWGITPPILGSLVIDSHLFTGSDHILYKNSGQEKYSRNYQSNEQA